jgi:hypothetical protein
MIFDMYKKELSKILHPIYSNNPYIGRIDASVIPRPHNAFAIVDAICKKEDKGVGIDWDNNEAYANELFRTMSSPKPFVMTEPLPLLSGERPGSTPEEPVVLKHEYEGMLNS